MAELRKDTRIYPKEFTDYKIRLDWDELTLEGYLGNISDSGICVILPHDYLKDDIGSTITGAILSHTYEEYFEFQGKIVWTRIEKKGQKSNYILGIQFTEPIQLSGSLLLKSMLE